MYKKSIQCLLISSCCFLYSMNEEGLISAQNLMERFSKIVFADKSGNTTVFCMPYKKKRGTCGIQFFFHIGSKASRSEFNNLKNSHKNFAAQLRKIGSNSYFIDMKVKQKIQNNFIDLKGSDPQWRNYLYAVSPIRLSIPY